MKRQFIALALGVLLLTTACSGLFKNDANKANQSTTDKSKVVPVLKQDYFTYESNVPAITAEIKNGEVWLTFVEDQIQRVGILGGGTYSLPDYPVKVKNVQGAAKSLFISDIGQDANPILCVLTDMDKVQILSLWNSVTKGDLTVTEIPMNDIVGFKAGGGGPWEDEEGNTYYGYETIYALDSRGGEHEIDLYVLDKILEKVIPDENVDYIYRLSLSTDWKMQYMAGYYLSEKVMELQGRFWLIEEDWDNMRFVFGYELTNQLLYTGESVEETQVSQKGTFKLEYEEERGSLITPLEGLDFCGEGMNQPVRFGAGDEEPKG